MAGRRHSLPDRASAALAALIKDRGWGYAGRLARAAGIPASSLTRITKGEQPVTLALLDALEQMDGTNPLHLLASPDDALVAVTIDEARLLRYLRLWPAAVQRALIAFCGHFANETPMDRELRNGLTMLAELPERQRRRVLAYMTMLSEGLPPDLEVALAPEAAAGPRFDVGERRDETTKRRKS